MILFFYFCFEPLLLHNCLFRNGDIFLFFNFFLSFTQFLLFFLWCLGLLQKHISVLWDFSKKNLHILFCWNQMKSFTLLFTFNYSTINSIFHFHFHFILFTYFRTLNRILLHKCTHVALQHSIDTFIWV